MDNYQKNINESMQRAFEKHLHEQYAINNNSNLSSIMTLFAALVAVFSGYGYIYLHSSVYFANSFSCLYCETCHTYSLDALLLTAMATFTVVGIMKYVCVYQGCHQRYEQFITYALRYKYYNQAPESMDLRIFPSYYTPFKKSGKNKLWDVSIVQGLFGEFVKIFDYVNVIIGISLLFKLALNILYNKNNPPHCRGGIELLILFYLVLFIYCEIEEFKNKQKEKYNQLEEEYKFYKPVVYEKN